MKPVFAFVALLVLVCCSQARANVVVWGAQDWVCGSQAFNIQLGDGKHDVRVKSLNGKALGAAQMGSDVASTIMRASLVAILATDFLYVDPPDGSKVLSMVPNQLNHSLNNHLYHIIMTQMGMTPDIQTVNITFSPPVVIPRGALTAYVGTESYDTKGVVTRATECIDFEMHLVVQYELVTQ